MASILVAVLVSAVLWPLVDSMALGTWGLCAGLIVVARAGMWREFQRRSSSDADIRRWEKWFLSSVTVAGLSWGVLGSSLLPEDPVHQAFVAMVLAGMIAGALPALIPLPWAYPAFVLPAALPFIALQMMAADGFHIAMGAAAAIFALVMLMIGGRSTRMYRESLELRYGNVRLVEALSRSHSDLERAYSALQEEVVERRATQDVLRRSEEKLKLHAQQSPLAFIEWDVRFRATEWNPAAERIFGYRRGEALGKTASQLIATEGTCGEVGRLWLRLLKERRGAGLTLTNRTSDGREIICEWYYTPLVDQSGHVLSVITLAHDVTDNRRTQERLNFLAYHDALTGLPNRSMLSDRLTAALAQARASDTSVAALLLDLDHFKVINESMGHEVGDRLLQDVAHRLSGCAPRGAMIARFGGDEFGLVLDHLCSEVDALPVAQRILDSFQAPFDVDGREIFLATSIGIAVFPTDGVEIDVLLKNADAAMYHAKGQGRNNFQFYSADLTLRSQARLAAETGLRRAVERREFEVFYQPKVSLETGAVTGVEALLRWHHPQRGLVPPLEFIPVAEDSGLIVPIGEWVLHNACAEIKAWHDRGLPKIRLSVNLSPRQFHSERLVAMVVRAIGETGFDPSLLELEITESVLMDQDVRARMVLEQLKGLGITIALDDFGTGFSSLGYLKRFPIDALKIDRSFVRDVPMDLDDVAIVRAVIGMARSLRLRTVAEGVEQEDQARFLKLEGCEEVQGFFYGKPMPAAEAERQLWIRTRVGQL